MAAAPQFEDCDICREGQPRVQLLGASASLSMALSFPAWGFSVLHTPELGADMGEGGSAFIFRADFLTLPCQ